ncbi:hypothetical protein BDY21DRAFT_352031 [Lineolata rhizophorae]|uniref:Uncharacterized protein n=1 Tax=Lineolata rhizophorae TaxID=578093 RepID=A0A6A6NT66_9PEZI|nr:hypothetical protein BDY21DRAFT_352031 [Lineolata rhizophorae]
MSYDAANRNVSHGRGGAGNIGRTSSDGINREELITPTIKSDIYTTGRGGSGNMAKNDPMHPEIARAAQDVSGEPPREPETNYHFGRGGAANVVRSGSGDRERRGSSHSGEHHKGIVEKGKEMLGLGHGEHDKK